MGRMAAEPNGAAATVLAKGRELGVTALSGVGCYANGAGAHEMRLAFSYQAEAKLVEGIRRLGAAMKAVRAKRSEEHTSELQTH